jgi:hypothetical protein
MSASGTSVRGWVARFRPRPVVLSSPYPVGECLRRLAEVTTVRGPTAWYLDPKTALRPDPRLRGDLGPSGISVVRWPAARGRPHSFQPWLRVRPEPAAGGGTTLTGTIGITPEERAVLWIIYGATGLIALGAIAIRGQQPPEPGQQHMPWRTCPQSPVTVSLTAQRRGESR